MYLVKIYLSIYTYICIHVITTDNKRTVTERNIKYEMNKIKYGNMHLDSRVATVQENQIQ